MGVFLCQTRKDFIRIFHKGFIPQTEPFYMADKSRSRKAGGAGLGLALVERIAALHGGELSIHSKESMGTCVEITF